MASHSSDHPAVERHCDVLVIGGSAAGLAAALQLGRQRRSVIIVDAGEPRNAPAAHMHGYLGRDGTPPADLTVAGREEVRSYGAEILDGRVARVRRTDDGAFRAELVGGHGVVARRILAATGLVDELPDIPGVPELWGDSVIHCPFCHGYEVRDRRIVQIASHPMALHATMLWANLASRLTLVLHEIDEPDPSQLELLGGAGVDIVQGPAERVVVDDHGALVEVAIADGRSVPADAVVVAPRFRARAEALAPLGLSPQPHPTGLGDHLATDEMGETPVAGVYAAGNAVDPGHQVLQAASDGARVGAMISFGLARDDVGRAAGAVFSADWEHRYSKGEMWSGNPNGALVAEAVHISPGRALDIGAGEGADAIWLAERGWSVVANDISARALERMLTEAEHRGLDVTALHADANAADAFGPDRFDLVVAMYASIHRTPDRRGLGNMLDAVAPGGTLLAVSHDLGPMRTAIDTTTTSRAFDPDAYVRVDDLLAEIRDRRGWQVVVHEHRPRPSGAASAAHHVDDVVLRAERRDTG